MGNLRKIFFLIAGALLCTVTAHAENPKPPPEMTLDDAIQLALRYNPSVQNSQFSRVSDKFSLRVAENDFEWQYAFNASYGVTSTRTGGVAAGNTNQTSALSPSASLNGKYGTTYSVSMDNPTSDGIYNPGVSVEITQHLLRGFGKDVTLAPLYNAQDQEVISKLSLKSSIISTVQSVIQGYRQLIQDQNDVQTSAQSLENYTKTINLDKALIKAGRKAPSEILQAQSTFASESVSYEDSKVRVINSKLSLTNQIGLQPSTDFKVPNNITEIKKIIPDEEESYRIALKNNPSYQTDLLNLKVAQRDLLVARDNIRASLDMTASAATGNGSGGAPNSGLRSLSNNKNTSVGLQFEFQVPINDYSLKQAIVSAKVSYDQAQISIEQSKRELKTTIINDISNIKSQWKQIELAEDAVELKEKNQEVLLAKLKFGLASTFEVTTNQPELDDARRQLISNKISYLNNLTQLYSDMGVLLEKWEIKVRY